MQHQVCRVCVSSTFSVFFAERNVLQKIVFAELERRCWAARRPFLGVDLRLGISPQRALSNRTMSTCLEEIRRCQEVSPKPNFLILLGDRYGWIPLPEIILEQDWKPLLAAVSPEVSVLMKAWYDCDINADPAVWILKPRTGNWENQGQWEKEVELPMGNAIRWAALNLSADRRLAYIGSATYQEIFRGLFAAADPNQVVAWCRNLRKAPLNFYSQSSEQIALLKRDVLDRLGERGVETNAKFEDVEKFQDPVSFTVDLTLTPYLQDFADSVTELLWAQIMLNTDKSTRPKLDVLQSQFIRAKAQGVVGREEELDSIRKFFSETDGGMHMLTGPGGQGKTSLLALACLPEIESHSDKNRFWIKRFAGAGGGIDSVETLLASMFPADLFDQFWKGTCFPDFKQGISPPVIT